MFFQSIISFDMTQQIRKNKKPVFQKLKSASLIYGN